MDEQYAARRAATAKATRRRRRVLALLVLAIVGTVAAAAVHRIAWSYVAIPAALLLAWLVTCRLMVRKERSWRPGAVDDADLTGEIEAVAAPPDDTSESPTGGTRPKTLGSGAGHASDVRLEAAGPEVSPHDRPGLDGGLDVGTDRGRLRAGP